MALAWSYLLLAGAAPRVVRIQPPLATERNSFLCTLRWRLALSIKKIRRLADLLPLKSAMSLITIKTENLAFSAAFVRLGRMFPEQIRRATNGAQAAAVASRGASPESGRARLAFGDDADGRYRRVREPAARGAPRPGCVIFWWDYQSTARVGRGRARPARKALAGAQGVANFRSKHARGCSSQKAPLLFSCRLAENLDTHVLSLKIRCFCTDSV
jgi:hypothetical protein